MGWGWAKLNQIAGMGIGSDRSGWGWAGMFGIGMVWVGIGWDGDGPDGQNSLDGDRHG